jgi:hypothetical protein
MSREPRVRREVFNLYDRKVDWDEDANEKAEVIYGRKLSRKRCDDLSMLLGGAGDRTSCYKLSVWELQLR